MRVRHFGWALVVGLAAGCFGSHEVYRQPIHEQRLPSGKTVSVVSCVLAWGSEHDERFPDRDVFALEYLAKVPREPPEPLEGEAIEAFELIRPISEQWGLATATVTALRSADHTGTWDVFVFKRSASGDWSHTSQVISRNHE